MKKIVLYISFVVLLFSCEFRPDDKMKNQEVAFGPYDNLIISFDTKYYKRVNFYSDKSLKKEYLIGSCEYNEVKISPAKLGYKFQTIYATYAGDAYEFDLSDLKAETLSYKPIISTIKDNDEYGDSIKTLKVIFQKTQPCRTYATKFIKVSYNLKLTHLNQYTA